MRFSRIDILRFGHLSNLRLAFDTGSMHVIYGENEAGKSTTLRAITGLLYGIPDRSPDTHTHGGDLRVAATLCGADGRAVSLQRRKGRKNTLLDADNDALPDEVMQRLLGGVTEDVFVTTFALDHLRLREGGEALLSGGGAVGESLLTAAVGGRAVHAVLASLRQEADALFLARGQKPRINRALQAFREAKQRSQQAGLRADTWVEQKRALAELRDAQTALDAQRKALAREEAELQRAVQVLPLLAARRALTARFEEVADALLLPEGFGAERRRIQTVLRECEIEARQQHALMEGLRARLARIEVPESLVGLGEEMVADIRDRLGSHRKAAVDLPRRREALRALQNQVRASLRRLGVRTALSDIETLRVARPVQARIRELAQAYSGRVQGLRQAEARAERLAASVARGEASLAELPESVELGALESSASLGRDALGLSEKLQALDAEQATLDARLARAQAGLGLFSGSPAELSALPLPPDEAVAHFAERERALLSRGRELQTQADALQEETERVRRQIEGLRNQADVPTEADLQQARQRRSEALQALLEVPGDASHRERFEARLGEADAVADRLRREARQVAQLSSWLSDQASLQRRAETLAEARRQHGAEVEAFAEQWRARFSPAGIEPLSPEEMAGWMQRRQSLIALFEAHETMQGQRALLRKRLLAVREQLLGAIATVVPDEDVQAAADDDVNALVQRLERVIGGQRQQQARRQALTETTARARDELAEARRAATDAQSALDAWHADWRARMEVLHLSEDATVEEAQAVLDDLAELLARADKADELRGRIEGMERDAEQFSRDVKRMYDRHLFELGSDLSIEEMADQLVQRYHNARRDLSTRQQLQADLTQAEQRWADIEARRGAAEQQLQEALRVAKTDDPEHLEVLEERSERRRALQTALRDNHDELLQRGDGMELSALQEATAKLDPDGARARLREVSAEREALDTRWRSATEALLSQEQALAALEQAQGAAAAASEAAEQLAELRDATQRYLRLRLSERVLERAIQRHREAHQGPIVQQAGALMQRLTLGAYAGLTVDYGAGDEPVLRCVQTGGTEVPVEGLSDATRDQLYLALRLSALREQASHAPLMPLVLDDILVHFDDARARAALEVLGEFSEFTQVLFFTHHARLLELSAQAVPDARLRQHRLGETRVPDGALFADGSA